MLRRMSCHDGGRCAYPAIPYLQGICPDLEVLDSTLGVMMCGMHALIASPPMQSTWQDAWYKEVPPTSLAPASAADVALGRSACALHISGAQAMLCRMD